MLAPRRIPGEETASARVCSDGNGMPMAVLSTLWYRDRLSGQTAVERS
jgi:hypothetical protein